MGGEGGGYSLVSSSSSSAAERCRLFPLIRATAELLPVGYSRLAGDDVAAAVEVGVEVDWAERAGERESGLPAEGWDG